jgi:hypothetical protein
MNKRHRIWSTEMQRQLSYPDITKSHTKYYKVEHMEAR